MLQLLKKEYITSVGNSVNMIFYLQKGNNIIDKLLLHVQCLELRLRYSWNNSCSQTKTPNCLVFIEKFNALHSF